MKPLDVKTYKGGLYLDILKFSRYSLLCISYEEKQYRDIIPCLLIQIGGDSGVILSVSLLRHIFTVTLIDRHYDF